MSFDLLGPDGGNNAAIGDFAAGGNFFLGDEKNSSRAFDVARGNTLSETAKLVCKGFSQTALLGPLTRWRYSWTWPVTGSVTELACSWELSGAKSCWAMWLT
jgi:hypothetical protein